MAPSTKSDMYDFLFLNSKYVFFFRQNKHSPLIKHRNRYEPIKGELLAEKLKRILRTPKMCNKSAL